MAKIGNWGSAIKFKVNSDSVLTFKDLKRKRSYRRTEHSIIGGLGEAVCAAVCETFPVPVVRIGVNDEFGSSGPAEKMLELYGLSTENIFRVAEDMYKRKNNFQARVGI